MAKAIGLPGIYTGAKAHSYFIKGHAAGLGCIDPLSDEFKASLSKACRKAYENGLAKGKADREARG